MSTGEAQTTVDWQGASASLRWIIRPTAVEADAETGVRVDGGRLNLCYNALDRHVVAGRSDETALVADLDGRVESWSWARLLEDVAALSGALRLLGAAPRTPVVVALPAGPDAVLALLACLRLGSVPHLVPTDTDAGTLARLVDALATPVVLTTAGTAWREALDGAEHQVGTVVVRQPADGAGEGAELTEPRDLEWDFVARAGRNDPAPCERVGSDDPAYALLVGGAAQAVATGLAGVAAAQQASALRLGVGQVWWPGLHPTSSAGFVWGLLAPLVAGATLVVSDAEPRHDGTDPVVAAHHVTASARETSRDDGGAGVEVRSDALAGGGRTVRWRDGAALPD